MVGTEAIFGTGWFGQQSTYSKALSNPLTSFGTLYIQIGYLNFQFPSITNNLPQPAHGNAKSNQPGGQREVRLLHSMQLISVTENICTITMHFCHREMVLIGICNFCTIIKKILQHNYLTLIPYSLLSNWIILLKKIF